MANQILNPFANSWFIPEYGDFYGNGPEFWLRSRCLLGVVAGSVPSDLGHNTVPTAKAYADALLQQLYRPSNFNPGGFPAFHAKKWAAGRLIVSVLSKKPVANPAEAANMAVEYAKDIVGKSGVSQTSTVFRLADHRLYDGYLLTEPMRRAVLMFEDGLRDNPDLPETGAWELANKAVAKTRSLCWAQPRHWLVSACTPWLMRPGQTPEAFYWLMVCADVLTASAPGDWVAQQMLTAAISGLPSEAIDSQTPPAMALYAMRLAKALEAASEEVGSPTTDPAYCWLSTMVLAELARASQAEWVPEEMTEAAEAAVEATVVFLQVVNAWPSV